MADEAVKSSKAAEKKEHENDRVIAEPVFIITETEVEEEKFDKAPNYFSLFEKQATTINLHDNSLAPVLAASHIVDQKSFDYLKRKNPVDVSSKKPRILPPIKVGVQN